MMGRAAGLGAQHERLTKFGDFGFSMRAFVGPQESESPNLVLLPAL